jgi:hypothetical protein
MTIASKKPNALQCNCSNCGNSFTRQRSTAKFCSSKCKQAVKNSRKVLQNKKKKQPKALDLCSGSINSTCPDKKTIARKPTRIRPYQCNSCRTVNSLHNHQNNFLQSTIGLSVIDTIARAGTLETFQSLHDLDAYVDMIRLRNSYDATGPKKLLNICHLSPLKGEYTVGLTSAKNCMIGGAAVNKTWGNKEVFSESVEGTHYLNRDRLNPRWKVSKGETDGIRSLIIEYFGSDLDSWAKEKKFTPRGKGIYKPPARKCAATFLIAIKQLFKQASTVLDPDVRHSISLAWITYQYQYLNYFNEHLEDQHFASIDVLDSAGEALQRYLMTGNEDAAWETLDLLTGLID